MIVGENKVGKSNLLFALRLILDPTLPDSSRRLKREDFWDGLDNPFQNSATIKISVDIADFEDDENLFAILAEHLIYHTPMVSRLTYEYRPVDGLTGPPQKESDYEFTVYGGDHPENFVGYEVRSRIPLDILQALRDAEGDLANWRRSPLRPLLDAAVDSIPEIELAEICTSVETALAQIHTVSHITTLGGAIVQRLTQMVGGTHAVDAELRLSPTDPVRLFRSLRLMLDGCKRGISEASLGTANLIYLALKSLELEQLIREGERDHSFLAIEEPEAHLHPHLQRLIYRDFLHTRKHQEPVETAATPTDAVAVQVGQTGQTPKKTVILTTHSPHIASVTPIRSFVLLRHSPADACTLAVSTANTPFTSEEVEDLERYLDVTRGELLFARGVLLVEGDAELYLIPHLARLHGVDLDIHGITVCSVSGTNFRPYVKLLGPEGLNIPHAVITDFDPIARKKKTGEVVTRNVGITRLKGLLNLSRKRQLRPSISDGKVISLAKAAGYFINDHTFEISLFNAGHHMAMCDTLASLSDNKSLKGRAASLANSPQSLNRKQFLKDVDSISKGRFAQRLCSEIKTGTAPTYIREAIEHVVERCTPRTSAPAGGSISQAQPGAVASV
ncbi:MAG: hypothetical protein BGO49_31220 [Planctomycetales bacterium 71-10]|nr:MAG: hypothetical protein BGO49_31220 [Planctomycetales bacterium 71-10]